MPLPSHARSFTLSVRLERNTNTSPQYGFARSASLTSADSVCTDLRKSTGCAPTTTLRSARSAITGRPAAPTAPSKASSDRLPARPDARPAHLDLDQPAKLCWWRSHLPQPRVRRRTAARLAGRRGAALGSDPDRHKAGRVDACRCRHLVSPHREQPTDNAIAARDLGNVGALLEALRYDPGLLLRRPPSPPVLPGDHLDTTIGIQSPPRRTQHADFPHCAPPFASRQRLWDLSCWGDFRPVASHSIGVKQPSSVVQPPPIPSSPAEALSFLSTSSEPPGRFSLRLDV